MLCYATDEIWILQFSDCGKFSWYPHISVSRPICNFSSLASLTVDVSMMHSILPVHLLKWFEFPICVMCKKSQKFHTNEK